MVRLGGRSRGNNNDPPGEYVDEQQLYRNVVPAFASSSAVAASGGGVTSMPPAFSSGPPTGGGTTRKQQQKSMTSGISTLFRRQPSPDIQIQQMQQVNSSNYGGNGINTNAGRTVTGSTTGTAAAAATQARTSSPPRQLTINTASYSPAQLMLLHGTGTTTGGAAATSIESGVGGRRRHFITKDRSVSFENIDDDDDDDNNAATIPNNITSSESNEEDGGMLYGDNIIRSEEDDEDDDCGSNIAARDYRHQQPRRSNNNNTNRNHRSSKSPKRTSKQQQQQVLRLPRRYRGFSTSISSLFLDESIVCGAVSCCGLLLASRTEHLLDERNAKIGLTRRGVGGEAGRGKEGGRRAPSRVLGVAWVITTLGVLSTYAIWGFDTGAQQGGDDYEYDYDYSYYDDVDFNGDEGDDEYYDDDGGEYDDANNRRLIHGTKSRGLDNNTSSTDVPPNRHEFSGIMKVRDYREHIFDPAMDMTNQAFVSLLAQFDADEYLPPHRYLEDSSSSSSNNSYVQGQQARAILIVLFLLLLGVIGRRRRMRTRFAIIRARAQDDHLYYASLLTKKNGASGSLATPDNTIMENFHEREDQYDGACSHTLLGCYPVDTIMPDYADYNEDDDDQTLSTAGSTKRGRKGGDFMGRTTTMILNCCCGRLCKCWCQLFSSCALAQEARETRLLLPPSMQRVDLMTHQPFQEYAKDVNNLRMKFMEKTNRTWLQHYSALSHLSRYILVGFILIMVFVLTTLLSHPTGRFGWGDAVVLIATFSQSFLVLFIVFGIFHRSDLSFDAVIKFFAVGFCICVSVGFILEAVLINSMLSIVYFLYYLLDWTIGENFQDWMTDNYRYVSIFSELINAYFVAALVEELCKYYGFRFVEHPDLLFLTGLDRTAKQAKSSGGLDAYKYDSQLISNFSSDHGCDSESLDSRGRRKMSKKKLNRNSGDYEDEVEPELRTLQQQAAAITTGMISVAVGLACAENCLYVFLLGGAGGSVVDVSVRLCILLFRSVFPIHALGAAMQSINMIRKFIEEKHGGERNIGVGRIIFPAVLLHGTFDAILMSVNAYIEASYESYYENGGNGDEIPFNAVAVNLIACLGIIGVMAVSFGWYSHQNKMQMLRLAMFDMTRAGSGLGGFHAPSIV